jgi:hypothetical protein
MRIALALLLVACGAQPVTQISVVPDPKSYDSTVEAVTAINTAAGEELVLMDGSHPAYLIVTSCGEFSGNKIRVGQCGGPPNPLVIIHEIGHAFGLKHSEDPESIMFKSYRVRPIDVAAASLVAEVSANR